MVRMPLPGRLYSSNTRQPVAVQNDRGRHLHKLHHKKPHKGAMIPAVPAPDVAVSSQRVYNVTRLTYGANTPAYVNRTFMAADGDAMVSATGASHLRWPGGSSANMVMLTSLSHSLVVHRATHA